MVMGPELLDYEVQQNKTDNVANILNSILRQYRRGRESLLKIGSTMNIAAITATQHIRDACHMFTSHRKWGWGISFIFS